MFGFVQMEQKSFTDMQKGKHWNSRYMKEEDLDSFEQYYKWTVVRDPWERELSLYNMMSNGMKYRHYDFKGFLKEISLPRIKKSRENNAEHGKAGFVFADQTAFFTDEADNVMVDKIVRYENLEAEWRGICKTINKRYEELPRLRAVKKKPMSYYYDQECIDMVAGAREGDIDYLKYNFKF
jgi:hypothetical protein